jgi:hypothetical protein
MHHKHLKNQEYYSNLYDRLTIDECKRMEDPKGFNDFDSLKDKDPKKAKEKKDFATNQFIPLMMYFVKGDNYKRKTETIKEWMERDQKKDDKVTDSIEPHGIRCLGCSSYMAVESKNLSRSKNNQEDVLFMFSCSSCDKRCAYWENGKEWEMRKTPCPKCSIPMTHSNKRKENIITTTYTCSDCEYTESDTVDLTIKEEKIDPNFEADRKKYCLSDKEGVEYISSTDRLHRFTEMMKDKEENKEIYDAVAKLKKLTVVELQNLLTSILEKENYIKLEFEKPEIGKDVTIGFSAQDTKKNRGEYDSRIDLQRLIKKNLENTNWRLMSDGISYRLGFLTGKLRGIEGEENLKKLFKKK